MISWFWIDPADLWWFLAGLPLQLGVGALLVAVAGALALRGRTAASQWVGLIAAGLTLIQCGLAALCFGAGVILRVLLIDPSPFMELMVYYAVGLAYAFLVGVGLASVGRWAWLRDRARPWMERESVWLGSFTAMLIVFELAVLVPLSMVGALTHLMGFGAIVGGAAAVCTLALATPLLVLILRGAQPARAETVTMPKAELPELGNMAAATLVQVLLWAVAALSFCLMPLFLPFLGLLVVSMLVAIRVSLRFEGRALQEFRLLRRAMGCAMLGVFLLVGVTVEIPGGFLTEWALDWVRPILATDAGLARRLVRSSAGGSTGFTAINELYWPSWILRKELWRRGPTTVPAIVSVLETNHPWIVEHEKPGSPEYAGIELISMLGQPGQIEPPVETVRAWANDPGTPRMYRLIARGVMTCLDNGQFVSPKTGYCVSARRKN